MKHVIHYLALGVALSLLFTGCQNKRDAALLEGWLNQEEPQEISLVYDLDGETCVETIMSDSTGHFTFCGPLLRPAADVAIYIGSELYGAYLEEGKRVRMQIDGKKATFEGDNSDRSCWNNTYSQVFSPWLFKPTPAHPFNAEEWQATLDAGYQQAMRAADAVSDPDAREAYRRLTEARKMYYTIQSLSIARSMGETVDEEQLEQLIASIDPNVDESRLSGLLSYWYNHAKLRRGNKRKMDLNSYFVEQIQAVDSALTNEGNKKSLLNTLTQMFLMYEPTDSCILDYRTALAPQLEKAPTVNNLIQQVVDARAKQVKDGDRLPMDPVLIALDGSKRKLSEVIAGKVAYIDIWATWCGPCCREIPYMEQVARRFAKDDRIMFVSISQDSNRDAWVKKMEKEKPEWPNYIFDSASGRDFLEAMSINGIPRFLLVGKDGRLIAVDAARPSADDIDQILNKALEN